MFMHCVLFICHLYTCIYSWQLMYMGWTQSNIYQSSDFKIGYTFFFLIYLKIKMFLILTPILSTKPVRSPWQVICALEIVFFLIKQNNYPSFYFYCILNLLTGIQIENVTILHELYVYTPVPWYDKSNQ